MSVRRTHGKPIPAGCYGDNVPRWLAFLTALPLAYLIWRLGFAHLRALSGPAPGSLDEGPPPSEPEDVEGLDVYLVCGECGTEYKVSRLRRRRTFVERAGRWTRERPEAVSYTHLTLPTILLV